MRCDRRSSRFELDKGEIRPSPPGAPGFGRRVPGLALTVLFAALTACSPTAAPQQPPTVPATAAQPTPAPNVAPSVPPAARADVIFRGANVITMDDAHPSAEAVAVRGDTLLAVGSDDDMAALRGPETLVIDVGGETIVPGFIDAHQYRVSKRSQVGVADAQTILQAALHQGYTTLHEMYVDQGEMDELVALDRAGQLAVRIEAYLPFMQYDPQGTSLGDWYMAYRPGQMVSPHVRVAGLIGFTDYDNATILLWRQDDLDRFVAQAQAEGWQVAFKTVSTRSLEMILKAYEAAAAADPGILGSRPRLEHALFVTADQISRIQRLGLVPIINLNNPGQLVGEVDVDQLISREPQGAYTPWRSLEQAGVLAASGTGWPSYYVDEPTGAPFGSPMHLIYQAVTRVGNLGQQPYAWLMDQTIAADQAMRDMTVNGAYASFEEHTKGSLTPGKLADLVVLSRDPLDVPAQQVNTIEVWMTMIGGRVEWCAPGHEAICPGAAPPPAAAADIFLGDWTTTDPADGSPMFLHVRGGGGAYDVTLVDDLATSCGLDSAGKPRYAAQVLGGGTAQGDVLSTRVTSLHCMTDDPTSRALDLAVNYTYQPATDTLIDDLQNAVWHRQ